MTTVEVFYWAVCIMSQHPAGNRYVLRPQVFEELATWTLPA
jgi:hypothetical protein